MNRPTHWSANRSMSRFTRRVVRRLAMRCAASGACALLSLAPESALAQDSARTGVPSRTAGRIVAVAPLAVRGIRANDAHARDSGGTRSAPDAQVRGRVLDAGAELPLPAASLRMEGNGYALSARSSIDGAFTFPQVPAGTYSLIVARTAYRPTRLGVIVPAGGTLVVDVQLTRLPVALARITVDASRADSAAPGMATVPTATLADGERTPRPVDLLTAQGGALSALAGETSGRRSGDPGSDRDGRTLYIWGAKDAGARVMLDGIALGAPLHLGGLLPVVDEDLMAAPRLWTAGASPRHDGGTDYVLDLSSRAPAVDSIRIWATADLLTARLGGEVPLGESGSVLAGARRVDEHSLARSAGVQPGYRYGDFLSRVQLSPAAGQVLRATAYATREGIGIPRDQGEDDASWENRAASASWERMHGNTRSIVRGGVSRASIDLPLLTLTDGHLRADADRATLLAEQRWSAPRWESSVGVEWEQLQVQRLVAGDSLGATVPLPVTASSCPQAAPCAASPASATVAGQSTSLYLEHRRALSPRLQLSGGVRASVAPGMEGAARHVLLPRVAVEAIPLGGTTMRVSLGRYSRLATFFDGRAGDASDPSLGSAVVSNDPRGWMTRATATQLELGGTQRLGRSVASVVGYWSRPGTTLMGQTVSRHRGVDASWRVTDGVSALQVSYSRILRSFVSAPDDSSAEGRPTGRIEQLASLQGATRLGRVSGTVAASYAHGLSFASVVLERPAAATRDAFANSPQAAAANNNRSATPTQDSYLRVDATVSAKFCVGGAGCPLLFTPYARVINALDRRDAIFYYSDAPGQATNRLAGLPALLSLGMRIDAARAVR